MVPSDGEQQPVLSLVRYPLQLPRDVRIWWRLVYLNDTEGELAAFVAGVGLEVGWQRCGRFLSFASPAVLFAIPCTRVVRASAGYLSHGLSWHSCTSCQRRQRRLRAVMVPRRSARWSSAKVC